jgi:GAF domain-containing protein/HAMP domain-containing protein
MNLFPVETLQLVAWFLAMLQFILALYILFLNVWHTANRHASGLLFLFAINSFALGMLIGAHDVTQAAVPTYFLAATSPSVGPLLLLVAISLLAPDWLRGRWRWIWRLGYILAFLPMLLTLSDVGLDTRFWYTGLDATTYTGGYITGRNYEAGSLAEPIRVLLQYLTPTITLIPLLFFALRGKEIASSGRRLAWLLLGAQVAVLITQLGLRDMLGDEESTLITNTIFVLAYAFAAFQQMISKRVAQRGRLQPRLMALILAATVPLLAAVVAFVNAGAGALLQQALVQQPNAELLDMLRQFQQVSWMALAVGTVMMLGLVWLTIRQAFQPIGALTDTATAIASGDLTRTAPVESEDEIGVLARAFNSMTERIRSLVEGLEGRVADRTAELERRAAQLQTAAEVVRVATSVLDLDGLLNQVVHLIGDRFNYYHASIFLLDGTRRWAVYRAGTGEVGPLIRSQGLRLEVGGASMVGWCVAYAQPRVARDVGQDALHQAHPLLPGTCSEAALPLIARGRVVGALDVQGDEENIISPEDITVLQILADQVAVAIDNVRLLTEVQESLDEVQKVHRHYLREAWAGFAAARPSAAGYRYAAGDVSPDPDAWLPAMAEAQQQNGAVITSELGRETSLGLPIALRGEAIGILGLRRDDEGEWTDDDVAVAQAVVDQVALSLENVRLFDEAQRRAQHEALVRELTDKMRRANEVDAILETAVEGLGRALGSARAFVRLDIPSAEQLDQENGAEK